MSGSPTWVTACIPYFRCERFIRGAVTSLLNQTHQYTRILVINDGDENAPWPLLADITDPRLVRFELTENRGPYFCSAVALEATPDAYFLLQDADDVSAPTRVEALLHLIRNEGSSFAFSAEPQLIEDAAGNVFWRDPRFATPPAFALDERMLYRAPHHALFSTAALRAIGGYFGGFRFGYDLLLMNLLLFAGTASWTPEHLYWQRIRPGSLTSSPVTGYRTPLRREVDAELTTIYRACFADYISYRNGETSYTALVASIRARVEARRGAPDAKAILTMAEQLRAGILTQWDLDRRSRIRERGRLATA